MIKKELAKFALKSKEDKIYIILTFVAVGLCFPAFLINIELLPFIGDEAIRATVASEMIYSGNYIVPSINGEFYFSKPPLYNWILILSYTLFGYINEYSSRVPTVVFTLLFGFAVWVLNRTRFLFYRHAILLALMVVTCGRMIFYDSYLGLIDIFFSLVTYFVIIRSYRFVEKGSWSKAYLLMFGMASVGIMLKGLPTLHFLFFNVLILHYLFGNWQKALNWGALVGGLFSASMLGLYYYLYDKSRSATDIIGPLIEQATFRSGTKSGIIPFAEHVLSYPFENIIHFLPWSVFGILAIRKDIISLLKTNTYILYCLLTFIFNFAIYWVSIEVYPRYILMLIPLIFTVWIFLYENEVESNKWRLKTLRILFVTLVIIVPIAILIGSTSTRLDLVPHGETYSSLIVAALTLSSYFYLRKRKMRPILLVIIILIIRIGFDLLIFPVRAAERETYAIRNEMYDLANKYGTNLRIYGDSRVNTVNTVYYNIGSKSILAFDRDTITADYHIVDSTYYGCFMPVDSFTDAEYYGMRWIVNLDSVVQKRSGVEEE